MRKYENHLKKRADKILTREREGEKEGMEERMRDIEHVIKRVIN